MAEFWKLALPLFNTPKSYEDMLKKLAGFAFYEVYLLTFLLRDIEAIASGLRQLETSGAIGAWISTIPGEKTLNVAGLMLALFVAFLSHLLPLHNRVSDLLGIRKRFDKTYILVPLAKLVGVTLTLVQTQKLIANRHDLMQATFYKYASSRAKEPLVDKHDIEHALNAWSWFWVFLEATIFWSIASAIAFAFGGNGLGWSALGVVVVAIGAAFAQYPRLKTYARREIATIARDSDAERSVRNIFNAL